jgi:hypothetical protein
VPFVIESRRPDKASPGKSAEPLFVLQGITQVIRVLLAVGNIDAASKLIDEMAPHARAETGELDPHRRRAAQ